MRTKTLVSFDFAIKYLLRNKGNYTIVEGFISALLKACGYGAVKINALLESESNKEQRELKQAIADLVVEDEQQHKYIVEIDRSYTSTFLHKACFNSSRLIVDSISANDDYSTIKKIFHINLLYSAGGKLKHPLYHGRTLFREVATAHPVSMHFSDLGGRIFEAHDIMPEYLVICIPLFNDEIQEELDEWLYVLKHTKVRADFKSPYMKQVADRLAVLNLPAPDLAAYRHYQAVSLKERDRIAYAKEEGMEQGLKKGLEQGEKKGLKKGLKQGEKKGMEKRSIEIAKNMLFQLGLDIDIVQKATGLAREALEELQAAEKPEGSST